MRIRVMSNDAIALGMQPAYPSSPGPLDAHKPGWRNGITKRELFAAIAMQGLLARPLPPTFDEWNGRPLVELATEFADALLFILAEYE